MPFDSAQGTILVIEWSRNEFNAINGIRKKHIRNYWKYSIS